MEKRKRIAFVNQRYGLEVNGGSEYYTRQLAEHLKDRYDIEILTTKALDHISWANYYEEDVEVINDMVVIRFDVDGLRDFGGMEKYPRLAKGSWWGKRYLEARWIDALGPRCPGLVDYLKAYHDDYDAIVFVTYLYYPAVYGVTVAPEKSILLPTAHDEPCIYMGVYKTEFETPAALIYLTKEEEAFAESLFDVKDKPHCIAGAGVDLPSAVNNDSFRQKFGISGDYLVYVGRIEPAKYCDRMIEMFRSYKDARPGCDLKLVLIGKSAMDLPEDDDIIATGFITEQEKFDGISGARALWLPSQFESLSIAVLEALSLGVPIIVNGDCEVLVGHCKRSKAGWAYRNETEVAAIIDNLLSTNDQAELSRNAKRYIEKNYTWRDILDRVSNLIDGVIERTRVE